MKHASDTPTWKSVFLLKSVSKPQGMLPIPLPVTDQQTTPSLDPEAEPVW
jgi:hypothetical protein